MREHEFPDEDTPRRFCKHCGALWHAQMDATCLERPAPIGLAPEPKRRQRAADDAEAIAARMLELAAERAAILNTPAEPENDSGIDAA